MNWPRRGRKHRLPPPEGDPELIEAIPRHFEDLFGEVAMVYHEKESEFVHLDLFQFEPDPVRGSHPFVTCGMAERPMNAPQNMQQDPDDYRYAELVLHLPPEWPVGDWDELQKPQNFWPLQAMKSFARLSHARESWVWGGHTMGNGDFEPYAPDTGLCCAFLAPSFQLPEKFEVLHLPGRRDVVFLTLLFLYREEWQFVHEHYSDAYFDLAKDSGMSLMEFFCLDKYRPNLCKQG